MKQSELTKLVGDKLDETTKQNVLDAINAETNSIVSERDEKIKNLKDENATLKTSMDMYTKEKEDYTQKLAAQKNDFDFLTKKAFVYKNVNNKLEDDELKELFALTSTKEGKFEDNVIEVAKKRNFMGEAKPIPELTPAPKPSSSIANADGQAADKVTAQDTMSWLGFNNKKK